MRLITDKNGTVIKRYNYTAFGSVLSDSGSFNNDYKFTSQAIDEENDLYYMHARYYDKSIGRFLSTDPFPGYLGIPSTMHPYNYCGNNPVNFVDPLGMNAYLASSSTSSSDDCYGEGGGGDGNDDDDGYEGPGPSSKPYSLSSLMFGSGGGMDNLFITREGAKKLFRGDINEINKARQQRIPKAKAPKFKYIRTSGYSPLKGMPAYNQQTGANPFHEWNPRSFSVNADMAAMIAGILGDAEFYFGLGSEFHVTTGIGILTIGISKGASIASTVSTWRGRGTSKPGYRPITTYDAILSTGATVGGLLIPFPKVRNVPAGIIFIYDYYRAIPVPAPK